MSLALTDSRQPYVSFAFLLSCSLHAGLLYILLCGVGAHLNELPKQVVYSVTLEGGSTRGGISQVPRGDKKTPIAPPKKVDAAPPSTAKKAEEVKISEKTAVKDKAKKLASEKDAEVSLAEKRMKEDAAKKEQKEKEAKAEKEKQDMEAKAKEEQAKKEAEAKAAANKTPTKGEVDKRYQQAMQRYLGESTDAGGAGFGGDGRGGKGMGGGVVKPPEWFLYKDALESYVKRGWNWHDPAASLVASVTFEISPTGVIGNIKLARSSGVDQYDESVMRAISKASPVPAAPPPLYQDFKFVEMDFQPQ